MAEYKVVFEIQVDAESPLEAAKTVQNWIQERGSNWQYVVQHDDEVESSPVYIVDLQDDDEDAICETTEYKPLIQ